MEIIQSIWNTITTENEILANIITSPLIFIEATVMLLLFSEILKITSSKKQKLIYIISISTFSLISKYIIPNPYGTILNLLFSVISIIFILKASFLKSILAIIIPLIITALIEYIISNTYVTLFNLSFTQLLTIPSHRFVTTLLIYLGLYSVYILLKKFDFKLLFSNNITKKNKILLIFCFTLTFISILAQSYLTTFYSDNLPFFITILSILSLLSLFFISIVNLTKTTDLEITKINLEETRMYNKTLSILHDNIRGFKHDFNNILQAISGYIATNDIAGLKKYYSQLEIDCQRANNLSALNPDTINNPAIYSILASKYHKADELGIKVNLEIFLDLNKLNMKIYEFTRILGILLDNAIEATSECTEKTINLIIRKDFHSRRQLLIIENTYNNKDVNTEKIFEKGYSSKINNTGLGLWEVRQILNRNNNLNLFTNKDNNLFKQQLEIY